MDIAHWWQNDLTPGPTGDLLPIDGTVRGQQRVLRRLMTNPKSYIWHPEYGAGLPLYIGQPVPLATLEAIIRQQVLLEACVSKNPNDPQPQVIVAPIPNGFFVRILYADAETGQPVTLSFDVNQ